MLSRRTLMAMLCMCVVCGCITSERRVEAIRSQHPEWDDNTIKKLSARQVEAGMTPEMVKVALGNPDSVSTKDGEEVWGFAYWEVTFSSQRKIFAYFVYFKDQRVVKTRGDVTKVQTLL